MIISYSRITLSSNGQKPNTFLSKNAIPASTRFFFPVQGKITTRNSFRRKVESKNDSLFPISKLDDEEMAVAKESKAILADKWKDIHGQNDWEGMLDPIDPLL